MNVDKTIFDLVKSVSLPIKPLVVICAWCDAKKTKTNEALAQGFDVSHMICEHHLNIVLSEE